MNELNKKASLGLVELIVVMAALTFLPAWTLYYWQAWILLAVFFACTLAIDLYLVKNDPKLLERRLKAGPGSEKERSQKIIQAVAMVAFIAIFVFSSLDHRFGWSEMPAYVSILGDVLVALGLYFVFLVFKENTFTSAIIEIGDDQRVITTGPYALVRHPMYIGALVMLIGVPLALGSWWGLLAIVPMILVLIWRLLDEEKFLATNLDGYCEYQRKVRYHLVPLIW
jgi:protein-S-isoprenylcysteine O-methyltransferase Ste14